jgi:hypothetical protein
MTHTLRQRIEKHNLKYEEYGPSAMLRHTNWERVQFPNQVAEWIAADVDRLEKIIEDLQNEHSTS